MNQTAGGGGYNYLNGYLSMHYRFKVGNNGTQQIAIGYSVALLTGVLILLNFSMAINGIQ